jgi:hypothetical protein
VPKRAFESEANDVESGDFEKVFQCSEFEFLLTKKCKKQFHFFSLSVLSVLDWINAWAETSPYGRTISAI